MAGNTVTLEFAGDESKLTRSMNAVGAASNDMGKKVGGASDDFKKVGRSADDWSEKSDTAEARSTGFADSLTGVKDAMSTLSDPTLSTSDKLVGLGQAGADLAGGFTNFIIPAVSKFWTWLGSTTIATWAQTAATTAWNAITKATSVTMAFLNQVIKANPILFLVGLIVILVAAFLALWTRSEGFRNFFIGMWNAIRNAVVVVVGGIKTAWQSVINFFSDFPGKIGRALGSLGSVISGAFKGALNVAIDVVNWGIDRINDLIYGVNVINPFSDVPSIPHIHKLHTGGVVPGMPGSEHLFMLQGGERVTPAGQDAGGGGTLRLSGDTDSVMGAAIQKLVRVGALQLVAS